MKEYIAVIISSVFALINFLYTFLSNRNNKKEQLNLLQRNQRLEVDLMYEKIRIKREEFEEILSEFTVLDQHSINEEARKLFLKSKTKYTALYNEINAFCTRIVDGTVEDTDYLSKEIIPDLKKLAKYQAEIFGGLNNKAKELKLPFVPQPDVNSFRNYNKVLEKYCKSNERFWSELKEARKENRLWI